MTWLDVEKETMRRIAAGEAVVDLRRCGIRDKGALIIAKTLIDTRNTKVTHINLWDNGIGDRGAMALAELIIAATDRTSSSSCSSSSPPPYQWRLNLRNNSIRNKGALALAEALEGNTTLTELRLEGQASTISTAVEQEMADLVASVEGIVKINPPCRNPNERRKLEQALSKNMDKLRQKRNAAKGMLG